MKKLLLLSLLFALIVGAQAQEKPDPLVFRNLVVVLPNPPKPVKGWAYQENWSAENLSDKELQHIPVLIGTYPGSILKFAFEGSAVGIAVVAGPNSGIIEFSVDEANWQALDLFAGASMQYHTLESDLKGKKHMLQIRTSEDKNPNSQGTECILKSFIVNKQ